MSRDVHSCTHWLRPRNSPLAPRIWTRITRALLVSKDRRHLFVTLLGVNNNIENVPLPPCGIAGGISSWLFVCVS
jgi:hypothetical protein